MKDLIKPMISLLLNNNNKQRWLCLSSVHSNFNSFNMEYQTDLSNVSPETSVIHTSQAFKNKQKCKLKKLKNTYRDKSATREKLST